MSQSYVSKMNPDVGNTNTIDRLGLLRKSCMSKYDRLEEINQALKEGDLVLIEIRGKFPNQSKISFMRLKLEEKRSKHGTNNLL